MADSAKQGNVCLCFRENKLMCLFTFAYIFLEHMHIQNTVVVVLLLIFLLRGLCLSVHMASLYGFTFIP